MPGFIWVKNAFYTDLYIQISLSYIINNDPGVVTYMQYWRTFNRVRHQNGGCVVFHPVGNILFNINRQWYGIVLGPKSRVSSEYLSLYL